MIYASIYFTILYKDSQKLEKTRKYRIPMLCKQGVVGSTPTISTKKKKRLTQKVSFCFFLGGEEKFRRVTTEN